MRSNRAASPASTWPTIPGSPRSPARVPLNTYSFFGQQAISVGVGQAGDGCEVEETGDDETGVYRRIVLKNGQLVGIATINDFVDAGIMWQLIRRRADLSAVKAAFIADPREDGASIDVTALALGERDGGLLQHLAVSRQPLRRLRRLRDRLRAGEIGRR